MGELTITDIELLYHYFDLDARELAARRNCDHDMVMAYLLRLFLRDMFLEGSSLAEVHLAITNAFAEFRTETAERE